MLIYYIEEATTMPTQKTRYTLELTRRQVRTLLQMILVADSVICGIHNKPEKARPTHYRFTQDILRFAHEHGFHKETEYSEEFKCYFPTAEFDDDGFPTQAIQEYEDESFFEDLIHSYFAMVFYEKHQVKSPMRFYEMALQDPDLLEAVEYEIITHGLKALRNSSIDSLLLEQVVKQ
jgi:hypothetical protein